jgi:hypothetical protein
MGLGPLVGLSMGFAVAILVGGEKNLPKIQSCWHNGCSGDGMHPWRCDRGCRLRKCIRGHPWRCCLGDMSGGIRIVVDSGLLEDILEVAESLDGGFAHVKGHLIVEGLCERPCCLNNPVFRGDRGICQIFVCEESCARDAGHACGYRPELPTPIVFG